MTKESKILIVGGNGFIGSWLADSLKRDHKVFSYDLQKQFSSYNPKKAAKIIAFRKKLLSGVKQYKEDVLNFKRLNKTINEIKPNIIVCLSSIPMESYSDEKLQFETEVVGISNILRINKNIGAKIVFMSSLFAIGHFDHAITENTHLAPITNYGIGKATGEHLVKAFAPRYGIIRTTSVYGPGDINYRVPQIIIEKALTNRADFWINKASLLDFIYVKDLAEGIKKVMFHNKSEVFNISGGRALTLIDFVKTVEFHTGKKLKYEVKNLNDRARRGTLVNDKARMVLKWQPKYNLDTGVKDAINTYKENKLHKI